MKRIVNRYYIYTNIPIFPALDVQIIFDVSFNVIPTSHWQKQAKRYERAKEEITKNTCLRSPLTVRQLNHRPEERLVLKAMKAKFSTSIMNTRKACRMV